MSANDTIIAPVQTETPVSAPAPAIEAPATPQPITADPKDRREVIKQAMNGQTAASRLRDEQGKFTAPGTKPTGTPPPQTEPPKRPAMPNTWNKELAPFWDQAPLEIVNRAIAREEEMKRGIEPLKTAKQQYDEIMAEIAPYEPLLKASNSTPKQAIANLFRTAALLRTGSPAEKAAAVSGILRDYGIPIEHLTANPNTLPSPAPTTLDPVIGQLTQQVQALTAAQQSEVERRVNSVIAEFSASPDHPHFAAVSETMAALLQTPELLGADAKDLPEMQRLQRAYDAAIRLNPEIHALVTATAAAPKPDASQASASPQRKPGLQVRGAPAMAAPPKVDPKDRRAVIRNALQRMA